MKYKTEKECTGYRYSAESDEDRSEWSIMTDYVNGNIYLKPPEEDDDIGDMLAFGRTLTKACRDMKRDIKDNRFEV